MPETFKAILVSRDAEKKQSVTITDLSEADLMEGDVTVAVEATTVNYKDGLAISGKAPVIRRWPLVPGIDFAGTVISSSHADWRTGDKVILNGWGVGETHFGAYAERARVKGDWLVPLPQGMSPHDAMAVGTAGYTAMLCVIALERHGIVPDRGPVVVTGAAGGVGSVAVSILSSLGYHVVASTGRSAESPYLTDLGASEVISRDELAQPAKPLAKERWAGGVDAVGSHTLANVLSMTSYGGAVAACGLAGGMDLPTSVAPVHPARCLSARHQFGDGAKNGPHGGVAPHRHGPRPPEARQPVHDHWLRWHHRRRAQYRRGQGPRSRGGGHVTSSFSGF